MSATFDRADYPHWIPLLLSKGADVTCGVLRFCQDWRSVVPFEASIPNVRDLFPPLQSYADFEGSLYQYAFETPSTALGDVSTPTAMAVLCCLVLLIRLIKSLLCPYFSNLGRRAGRHTHGPDWEQQNELRILKFGEYVFRLLYHTVISIYGIMYFHDKPWWDESKGGTATLFRNYPAHPIEPGMAWYYLVQSAYNIDALLSLLELSFVLDTSAMRIRWSDTVRGDFQEMFVHHLVTNALVIGSSVLRTTRVGSMVFLVHDVSDIPVDLSKLANFLKWKVTTAVCFSTMVIMWAYWRLYILPYKILGAIITQSVLVIDSTHPNIYVAYQPVFVCLLSLIILLHLVWFSMFIKMGMLLVFKWEAHDLSEHKGGESQDGTATGTGASTTTTATTTTTTAAAAGITTANNATPVPSTTQAATNGNKKDN